MLSTSEIVELEKKLFRYRLKKNLSVALYLISGILLLAATSYLYISYSKPTPMQNMAVMESNLSVKSENILPTVNNEEKIEDNMTKSVTAEPLVENNLSTVSNETLELHLPVIKSSKNTISKELPTKTSAAPAHIKEEMPLPQPKNDEAYYRGNEDKIESIMLAPPSILADNSPKSKITIETQEINSIQYLKDKFDKTHNIIFALMLAEENYLNKNYQECNKWALIANSIDSESEKSWIWFAKSKIKLGQKQDAVTALQAYLKTNKSSSIQTLLNQINLGELRD